MSRLCERPGCAEPSTVAFGFDPSERMVWLASLHGEGPQAGALCRRHADAMRLPNGWWLDDRRGGDDALFASAPADPVPEPAPKAKPRRPKRPKEAEQPLPCTAAVAAEPAALTDPPADEGPGDHQAAAWTPAFDAADDLGGQLQAATPLLSRAFGGGTALPPTPSRTRKQPPTGA